MIKAWLQIRRSKYPTGPLAQEGGQNGHMRRRAVLHLHIQGILRLIFTSPGTFPSHEHYWGS